MRIIAFIEDYRVIKKILDYLGIYEFERDRPLPSFQNRASVNRIIFGVISGLNKNWKVKPLKEFTQKN